MVCFHSFRIILSLAALVLSAAAVSAGVVIEERPSDRTMGELRGALAQLDRDAAAPRSSVYGHSALRSKGIIIVGGKTGPSRPAPAAKGIIIVNSTRATTAALRRLGAAVRKFEQEAGPDSPQVAACRRREGQCLAGCRAAMRQLRLQGQCSCIGVRAHCLNTAKFSLDAETGKVRFGDGVRGRRPPAGK